MSSSSKETSTAAATTAAVTAEKCIEIDDHRHENEKNNEDEDEEEEIDQDEDDYNNNYICESDDDDVTGDAGECTVGDGSGGDLDDHDESVDDDPERFDYECMPLSKIDSITETKCRRLVDALRLDHFLDAVYLLKQFKWNCARVIDLYSKDKHEFLAKYFSDDNNNNSQKSCGGTNKNQLSTYINIFGQSTPITMLMSWSSKSSSTVATSIKATSLSTYCQICYRHVSNESVNKGENNKMLSLDECGHEFCSECWHMHFVGILNSACQTALAFECMQTKCKSIAGKEFVLQCLIDTDANDSKSSESESSLAYKYRCLVATDLVKESDDLQMCPGEKTVATVSSGAGGTPKSTYTTPLGMAASSSIKLVSTTVSSTPTISFSYVRNAVHKSTSLTSTPSTSTSSSNTSQETKKCNYIVWSKGKPAAARRVVCTWCSTQYCFACQLPYHAPNACETIRRWNIKCQDDSETRNYLLVHTQDCPKCKVCIEKNGGCSHMTCNRCKHEFCWVCSNDWKTHGATYDCNRYKGNPEQDTAREALNRYTHYYHRWINHANSLKFEKALREQWALKIHEKIMTRSGGGTLVDWEFLSEAVEVLTRARYTLQYTYPYAYYLNNGVSQEEKEKLLFENIQAELEREVENLSHSLEKVSLNDKYNIRIQMSIVEKRRRTLLKDFIK